jgi:acetyl-CoA carboxylase biotin carboxyl carrier protein
MDFEKIKELIKLVDSSNLAFFEIRNGNDYIKMDKSLVREVIKNAVDEAKALNPISSSATQTVISQVVKPSCEENLENICTSEIEKDTEILRVITSPMVGTFYSKVSPDSEPFVKVGDKANIGKIICIVEAMKLMNEIESEYTGEIVEILVKDGQMVEYGQPLFKVNGE